MPLDVDFPKLVKAARGVDSSKVTKHCPACLAVATFLLTFIGSIFFITGAVRTYNIDPKDVLFFGRQ